jgi:hypothetical protein
MKKSLLLSVVACGLIYAGGNIAPAAPVEEKVATPSTTKFWGSLGYRFEAVDNDTEDGEFGDAENNLNRATVVLGAEKEIGYGVGVGAEVAASFNNDGEFEKLVDSEGNVKEREDAELSQLYLTYKYGNTAIKAGRQALPKAVSPWAWSDTTLGRVDTAYDAVVVVNTDVEDTTLVGAWVRDKVTSKTEKINDDRATVISDVDEPLGDKGVFMLGAINNSIEDVTLSFAGYYIPDYATDVDVSSAWAAAEGKYDAYTYGAQVAYADVDADNLDSTVAGAAYVGTNVSGIDLKLTAAYINDGDAPLNIGGTSGFWGDVGYAVNTIEQAIVKTGSIAGDTVGEKQIIGKLDASYDLPENYGKVYAGVAYDKYDDAYKYDKAILGRVGYSFTVADIKTKIEYRYQDMTGNSVEDVTYQKVRVDSIYKF